jgi:hypothetical protein
MDPRLQASFIPKKPLMEHSAASASPPKSINLFSLIGWLVLIVSICAAVGVFMYNSYLTTTINGLTNAISTVEAQYSASSASLSDYSRMDSRLKTATLLLNNHIAASPIFAFLDQNTAQNVRFLTFSFTLGPSSAANTGPNSGGSGAGSTVINVTLTGEAKSFNSLAVQANVFSANPLIQDPIISGIGLDLSGNVTFSVTARMNESILNYSDEISGGSSELLPVNATLPVGSATSTAVTATSSASVGGTTRKITPVIPTF